MVDSRRILGIGCIVASVGLFPHTAGAVCPLATGTETVWQLDSMAQDTALSACTAQPGDCSLVGVIKKINVDLKAQCTPAELGQTGIRITFEAAPVDSVTLDVTQTLLIRPPSGLGGLMIDGRMGSKNFTFKTNPFVLDPKPATEPTLQVKCTSDVPTETDCAKVTKFPALDIGHLNFESSWTGVLIDGRQVRTGGEVHLHDLMLTDVINEGVRIEKLTTLPFPSSDLTVDHVTVQMRDIPSALSGLHILESAFDAVIFDTIHLNQSALAGFFGINWENNGAASLLVKRSKIAANYALYLSNPLGTAPALNKITLTVLTINFLQTGLAVDGHGEQIQIAGSTFTGQQKIASKAIRLTNSSSQAELHNTKLSDVTVAQAYTGVAVVGNVRQVALTDTTFDTITDYALRVSNTPNIPAPAELHHHNTRFIKSPKPALYSTSPAGENFYANGGLDPDPLVTQAGVDTPPVSAPALQLLRDWQDPAWVQVTVSYPAPLSIADLFVVQLYLKKGGNLLPLNSDGHSKEALPAEEMWNLSAVSRIDAVHCPGYDGTPLNQLSVVAVVQHVNAARMPLLTSMFSPAQSLTNTRWKGTQHLVVDTVADSPLAALCTEAAGDCSLRGAVLHVMALRESGHTHQVEINFSPGLPDLALDKTLTMASEHVDIVGHEDGSTRITPANVFALNQPLLKINVNHVRVARLTLDAQKKASPLVDYTLLPENLVKLDDIVLDHVTFTNLGPNQHAVAAPYSLLDSKTLGYAHLIDPVFVQMDATAHAVSSLNFPFQEGSGVPMQLAYIERMRVTGLTLPGQLVPGTTPGVVITQNGAVDVPHQRVRLFGRLDDMEIIDTKAMDVDVYVSFSKQVETRLAFTGSYQPVIQPDGSFELEVQLAPYTHQDLLSYGPMSLSLLGQLHDVGLHGSTVLSAPVVVFDPATADTDKDGVLDINDNAPLISNPDQADVDHDGSADVVDDDDDDDDDGVLDVIDNCAVAKNPDQTNTDGDAAGNACDEDDDSDGVLDTADNCALTANPDQQPLVGALLCTGDQDHDGVPDTADNSPDVTNPDQLDSDGDGQGDASDADKDNDGTANESDNSPLVANPDKAGQSESQAQIEVLPPAIGTGGVVEPPTAPPAGIISPAAEQNGGGGCSLQR